MTSSETLLCPFGTEGDKDPWFNTAMSWERDAIFDWLDKCSKGQAGGAATADPATREVLVKVLDALRSLSVPSGVNYENPDPACHIIRELNPSYKAGDATSNRFNLLALPTKYTYAGRAMTVPYYTPNELLGLFLALLGPAEQAATQYSYFLPLLAVFGRWCTRIAGAGKNGPATQGVGPWPAMFCISWRAISNEDPRRIFFLGASMSGDDFTEDGRRDSWRELLQRRRFDVVFRTADHFLFLQDEFMNIKDVVPGSRNQPGNCAEAYTFTHTIQSDKAKNSALNGIAMRRDLLVKLKFPTTYDETQYRGLLVEPCPTCQHALARAGGVLGNFRNGAK